MFQPQLEIERPKFHSALLNLNSNYNSIFCCNINTNQTELEFKRHSKTDVNVLFYFNFVDVCNKLLALFLNLTMHY